MNVNVFKIPQRSPDDLSGLNDLIQSRRLDPTTIVAILGKTEGNGCVNDFTRGFAVSTLKAYLADHVGPVQTEQIVFVMSGGTEGVLSPHLTVFTREDAIASSPDYSGSAPSDTVGDDGEAGADPADGRLAVGVHHTRDFTVAEIGTLTMVEVVAAGVQAAIASAAIDPTDVHFVQIKCPLITSARGAANASIPQDSYKSMAYSRGAAALGVAVALGEYPLSALSNADICTHYDLFSSVASTSAGVELLNCEILVLGNSRQSRSVYRIGHSVMAHALDGDVISRAIASATPPPAPEAIVNVFAKAEASPTGEILGCRHTMLDDSDINHTRMARAVVGAVLGAAVQTPMIYVSGGAEHQGPPGGGPVAVIWRHG